MLLSLASSAATLSVEAVVDQDLQHVTGQLKAEPGLSFTDPLALLPQPKDDLTFSRTFHSAADLGSLHWTEQDGELAFEARLPKRYGAVGVERGALWANGAWYPQPEVDVGSEGVHDWTVTLTLPPGSVGVINGVAGQGTLEWSGQAERLSIAVFDGGELLELAPGVQLLSRGLERPRRDEQLAQLTDLLPEGSRDTVVVEAPMFRRLVRTGPGVLYLSDMAWRTPKPLWRFHNRAVLQGLVQAAVDHPSRVLQELYAAALTPTLEEQLSSNTADQFLRWGAFLPLVDMLLYSGRVPFHAELFGEVYPGDPLRDDLAELYSVRPSGQVLAVKIDDDEGEGSALKWAEQRLEEYRLDSGLGEQDPSQITASLSAWIGPWPEQDYQLSVTPQDSGFLVNVARQTEPNAASEVVTLDIDGEPHRYESGVGPGQHQLLLDERPKRVALDPNKHLHQQDLSGDVWPARWTAVGTVAPQTYNLSERILVGYGVLRLRKRYDTHNLYMLSASTDAQNALSARATYLRYFGPLQDRRLRNQRVSVWAGGSWLSSNYRETVDGRYALEMGASAVVDTRVDWRFPIQGHRMAAAADLGVVPESGQRWSSGSLSLSGVRAVHPRAVFALALSGGVALGEVQHRLLSLGGPMSSLPPGLIVGQGRAVAAGELRILAFKNLSVPLAWLYWLDEVQFTTGLEVGTVRKASVVEEGEIGALSSQAQALGWTGSVLLTMDGLGAIPWTVGVVLGVPVWTEGLPESAPQLGLTLGQAF